MLRAGGRLAFRHADVGDDVAVVIGVVGGSGGTLDRPVGGGAAPGSGHASSHNCDQRGLVSIVIHTS